MSSDQIQKNVSLNAPLERVLRAISKPEQFGRWFGMAVAGPFVQGEWVKAKIVPTEVDAEVATFELEDRGDSVMLTITESGFDRIPLERRAKVFADNSEGWELQARLIRQYLALYPNG